MGLMYENYNPITYLKLQFDNSLPNFILRVDIEYYYRLLSTPVRWKCQNHKTAQEQLPPLF